jgi:hypothetical protein
MRIAGLTMLDWDFPWCLRANSALSEASEFWRPEDFRCEGMALFKVAMMGGGGE